MKIPQTVGPIHFVGIGGIGMSGIARVMHNLGYKVQGSDIGEGSNVLKLREKGIEVAIGHAPENLDGAGVIVVSSAIKQDNPELQEARRRFLPVVRRAEMLAELMRLKSSIAIAGTHGKTTTTSLVAALLDGGGLDPTVINGGIINAYGSNARLGGGDWMVVEADESDGTFVKLPADIAIVTNIDPEHLDHYGDFEGVKAAFHAFVENVPFYGFAVMCLDHPEVQSLIGGIEDRRIITYGTNPQADARISNVRNDGGAMDFDVGIRNRITGSVIDITDIRLAMPGDYNVQNATAAIVVACELGISPDSIRKSLAEFGGVKRRFTLTGVWNGVSIYDDYAHHPVEISAVLQAARQATSGRVLAIVQPHRFSRLKSLFVEFCSCFNDADTVIVTDVFSAGEDPIEGFDKQGLVEGLRSRGHRSVLSLEGEDGLADLVRAHTEPDDLVIFLGAGSITKWANDLPGQLVGEGS
jgi:UDP-N-acetylmuramate--alanine ligase